MASNETKTSKLNKVVFGDLVYHVANPQRMGMVLGRVDKDSPWIKVFFFKPVGFSGNPWRGLKRYWLCSENLLFSSEKEAIRNHDPLKA